MPGHLNVKRKSPRKNSRKSPRARKSSRKSSPKARKSSRKSSPKARKSSRKSPNASPKLKHLGGFDFHLFSRPKTPVKPPAAKAKTPVKPPEDVEAVRSNLLSFTGSIGIKHLGEYSNIVNIAKYLVSAFKTDTARNNESTFKLYERLLRDAIKNKVPAMGSLEMHDVASAKPAPAKAALTIDDVLKRKHAPANAALTIQTILENLAYDDGGLYGIENYREFDKQATAKYLMAALKNDKGQADESGPGQYRRLLCSASKTQPALRLKMSKKLCK